jgi:hypothetical protein
MYFTEYCIVLEAFNVPVMMFSKKIALQLLFFRIKAGGGDP